ncbi:MAG: PilZ domain-containing protein [Nitrospirae bacterium]|nr:PilZ domain-containing protein [Nitrospirota bacterium]
MSKRRHERFVRRLETEFSAEGKEYRAISSDLSLNGLFIRTNHAFAPGSLIDIVIHLPDGSTSRMRGRVRRALKTTVVSLKNGMGVELIDKDSHYMNFMKSFYPDLQEENKRPSDQKAQADYTPRPSHEGTTDFMIVQCIKCGVKNKISKSKIPFGPKCGKCGSALIII